ncbi:MAG: hypothetical protein A2289_17310 [Deltaproteobacteria bacterium RIFOXYA12_FULL_58_15]|nr:MAG: hypothetical protein A2289_17310 [Deltaproteobacteria bacterium RIFOXYA12_FULL_58_15]OGR09015.1 MAG: hypothetical protein A2341_26095 [Deltaproteobacteria bacterium RIFOXYB12_FULL_58_9]
MRALTIRNIPDETYRALTARAQRNRRSLQQEALLLLERGRSLEKVAGLDRARSVRERLRGRKLGDTLRELGEERNR